MRSTALPTSPRAARLLPEAVDERSVPATTSPAVAVLPMLPGVAVALASVARGRDLLGSPDRYTDQLTPFDLTAKLQRRQAGTTDEYLEHARRQVRPWLPEEVERMADAVARVGRAIRRAGLDLPLPPVVEVVRSTLAEEGHMAGYTRRHFVVLGPAALDPTTLAHELFHVLSRCAPELRERLYGHLGARLCTPIPLPAELRDTAITNPDAPFLDTVHTVYGDDGLAQVTMALLATGPWDGGPLGRYLRPALLQVEDGPEGWAVVRREGAAVVLEPSEAGGLFGQLGDNTSYRLHPEEVCAEHFVQLLAGCRDVPRPELLAGMWEALRQTRR